MTKGKGAVAYTSVYMDQGEGWDDAKKQIDAIMGSPNNLKVYFFGCDVIGHEYQRAEGEALAEKITEYVKDNYSAPELERIGASFSLSERQDNG